MNPIKALTRTAGLLLCTAVFAGTAFAGDKPRDDAPGNSGNAPGQEKKAEEAPPVPAPEPAAQAAPPAAGEKQAEKGQHKEQKAAAKAAAKAERKQARPQPSASANAEAKAEKPEKSKKSEKPEKGETPAKAEQRSKGSGSYKATSSGTDLKKGMSHKHTICHATGSATNPYVVITPSVSGVFHGHLDHQGERDIVPPFVYRGLSYSLNWDAEGQALFANGCRAAEPAPTTTTTPTTTAEAAACPPVTKTVTEIVVGGVFHKTGNGFVFIRPSKGSAHYDKSKHPDDIVIPDQRLTRTVEEPGTCDTTGTGATTTVEQVTTTVTVAGATVTLPATTTTLSGSTASIPAQTVTVGGSGAVADEHETSENETAGVLGKQTPPGAAQERASAGGVLGAVASLGRTATTGSLPFTGLPLWLVALVGGGLLATGFALRHADQP